MRSGISVQRNVPHVCPAHLLQLPLKLLHIYYIWYTADICQGTLGVYAKSSVQYIP